MRKSELKQIIKEEISKVLNEATLLNKGTKAGSPAEIKVNDYVQWTGTENDRGMRIATDTYIGKVVKILGSKNMQVEVVFPLADEGDMYSVSKVESKRIPVVGEIINAEYSWDGGQGSGSQGSDTLTGTVTKVDLPNAKITVKDQGGKSVTALIEDLDDITISK
jgi:hypothetical protein